MSTNKWNYKQQKRLNNVSYMMWFDYLAALCQARFKWELPDTANEEMLERAMFRNAKAVFFQDEGLVTEDSPGIVTLPFMQTSNFTIYGYPKELKPFSYYTGAPNYDYIPISDCVVCFANIGRYSDWTIVDYYASRLSDAQRTIDINLAQQKSIAGAMVGSDAQKKSMEAVIKRISENTPFIVVDKDMFDMAALNPSSNSFMDIRFDVPYIADKVQVYMHNLVNEFLTKIGIENTTQDKRERMVADETNANIGSVEMARRIAMRPREKAAKEASEKWGVTISVEFNSHLKTLLNEAFDIFNEEDVDTMETRGVKIDDKS